MERKMEKKTNLLIRIMDVAKMNQNFRSFILQPADTFLILHCKLIKLSRIVCTRVYKVIYLNLAIPALASCIKEQQHIWENNERNTENIYSRGKTFLKHIYLQNNNNNGAVYLRIMERDLVTAALQSQIV